MTKTFLPSVKEVENSRKWHLLDASERSLGRVASEAAKLLIGKHKVFYTPHMDCGDYVIIINAKNLRLTGNKIEDKYYFRHSGYSKGAQEIPVKRQIEKDPTVVVELAVKRMLDNDKLRARRMKRLRIFADNNHSFENRFKAEKIEKAAKSEKVAEKKESSQKEQTKEAAK